MGDTGWEGAKLGLAEPIAGFPANAHTFAARQLARYRALGQALAKGPPPRIPWGDAERCRGRREDRQESRHGAPLDQVRAPAGTARWQAPQDRAEGSAPASPSTARPAGTPSATCWLGPLIRTSRRASSLGENGRELDHDEHREIGQPATVIPDQRLPLSLRRVLLALCQVGDALP
jgi:hypothetical protein